jgi:hypothetical protein
LGADSRVSTLGRREGSSRLWQIISKLITSRIYPFQGSAAGPNQGTFNFNTDILANVPYGKQNRLRLEVSMAVHEAYGQGH